MPKVCSRCKGNGWVYPLVTIECGHCYNHPAGKKTCCECMGKGWQKVRQSALCTSCDGGGKVRSSVGS